MGATGTGSLDFGAFPGKSDASLVITGQAGIVAGSLVEAWLRPVATADHTADEHMMETLTVLAGNIVAGTGFTIYGMNFSQLSEPQEPVEGQSSGVVYLAQNFQRLLRGGLGTRIWGVWTVAWVWS